MGVCPGQLLIVVCIRVQGWAVAMIDGSNLPIGWSFCFGIRDGAAANTISLQVWCVCERNHEDRLQDKASRDHLQISR